ncbi:hypothetical protein AgCh_021315 [Apium graveolens]
MRAGLELDMEEEVESGPEWLLAREALAQAHDGDNCHTSIMGIIRARVRGSSEHSSASPALTRVKHPPQPAVKDPGRRRRSSPATRSYHLALEGGDSPSLGLGAPGVTFINKLFKESIYSNLSRERNIPGATTTHSRSGENRKTRDARTLIELNQYKYTNVPVAEEHMANLTSEELAEAIRLYRQEQTRLQEEAELEEESEESGDSQQSKKSVFDRIGAKGKKSKKDQSKKESEAAKQRKLEEVREQIRKEEEAKLELKIQKRMQLEEEKLAKSRSKRTRRDPTPELISDDEEEEGQKDVKDMIYELQRKMDRDSGVEVEETLTPFSHSLEAIPRQRNLKHYNFDSFDGLGDPEEHLNYFEQITQIYYYNDLTKSRFFASTLKGGPEMVQQNPLPQHPLLEGISSLLPSEISGKQNARNAHVSPGDNPAA